MSFCIRTLMTSAGLPIAPPILKRQIRFEGKCHPDAEAMRINWPSDRGFPGSE
jgi:hypothetical protein